MSELAICDKFKWTLDYVRDLKLNDYMHVVKYLKKLEAENKKAARKSKRR